MVNLQSLLVKYLSRDRKSGHEANLLGKGLTGQLVGPIGGIILDFKPCLVLGVAGLGPGRVAVGSTAFRKDPKTRTGTSKTRNQSLFSDYCSGLLRREADLDPG
jgi:hypothetical protein